MAAEQPSTLDNTPELTATQYVILAESQRKKRALAEGRIKYNALVDENKKLLVDRSESERQTYEVMVPTHLWQWRTRALK